jgi:hypothetical protein
MEEQSGVKDCCKNPENLEVHPSDKPELEICKCRVCGLRHFELTLDPGIIGLKGVSL